MRSIRLIKFNSSLIDIHGVFRITESTIAVVFKPIVKLEFLL